MVRKFALTLVALLVLAGCGGGGGSAFIDDPFFDDTAPDLLAIDDTYSTLKNQVLAVGDNDGVLANDFLCCPDFDIKYAPVTASGGTVVGRDDGSFVYTPPANFTGTDFFDYELEDDFGTSIATVFIDVDEPPFAGAFVDSARGSDNTGSVATGTPYSTIQAAVQAAGPNRRIIVRPGTGQPYFGAVNLQPGQILIGEGFENIFPQGVTLPRLRGPIVMANDCKLTGLRVEATSSVAVNGNGSANGEIVLCELSANGSVAVDLAGATGDWFVDDNLVENSSQGLRALVTSNQQLTLSLLANTFQNNTVDGLNIAASNNGDLALEIRGNTFSNHPAGQAVTVQAIGNSALCLDLDENQNDNSYRLTRQTALFQVEEFSLLSTLNTGTVISSGDPIQEVADGFCGF